MRGRGLRRRSTSRRATTRRGGASQDADSHARTCAPRLNSRELTLNLQKTSISQSQKDCGCTSCGPPAPQASFSFAFATTVLARTVVGNEGRFHLWSCGITSMSRSAQNSRQSIPCVTHTHTRKHTHARTHAHTHEFSVA